MFEQRSAMNNPAFNYELNLKRAQKMGFTRYVEQFSGYTIYFNEDETEFALVTNESENAGFQIRTGLVNDLVLEAIKEADDAETVDDENVALEYVEDRAFLVKNREE